MSGVFTPGLSVPSTANLALPIPAAGLSIPADTGLTQGAGAESVAVPTSGGLLASIGNANAITIVGSAITADASLGSLFSVTLAGTNYAFRLLNMSPGQLVEFYVTQDGTGSRTISTYKTGFGAGTASDTNIIWPTKAAPTLSTTGTSLDVLSFRYNATTLQGRGSSSLNCG